MTERKFPDQAPSLIRPDDPEYGLLAFLAHADTTLLISFPIIGNYLWGQGGESRLSDVRRSFKYGYQELGEVVTPLLEYGLLGIDADNDRLWLTPNGKKLMQETVVRSNP